MENILITNPFFQDEIYGNANIQVDRVDEESFGEWVERELEDNGVYEFDGFVGDSWLIQIPDDEQDWRENFNEIVRKVKEYFNVDNMNEVRNMVRKAISEMHDIQESDLVARKGDKSWVDQKSEFKDNINELLSNIEDDKYADAQGVIVKTVKILNTWHKRIKEGTKGNVIDED